MTSLLSFDLETHLVQPGLLAPPIVCGSFADRNLFDGGVLVKNPIEFLEDTTQDVVWVGANIAYDFACVLAARPDLFPLVWRAYEEERVFDVQIVAMLNAIADGRLKKEGTKTVLYLMDGTRVESGRYSLDLCVREWLGRTNAKENDRWRNSYALLEHLPISEWPEDARQYPIDDAVNTLEVAEAQLKHPARNIHNQGEQAHAAFAIHLGAVWGLRTDGERVAQFKADVEAHLETLRAKVAAGGLMKPKSKKNPTLSRNMKEIRERVFKAYDGLPPKTATGNISTEREVLEDSDDPDLEALAEMGRWAKFDIYVPSLVEASRKPLNVKPNVLLATGRTSYDGLIQLMPRKGGVRECFVARPGCVWSSVDYAAIEMSTLAQVHLWTVGRSSLATALNDDLDPHSLFAAKMMGLTYEDFLARKKEPELADKRQAAKAANFGFPGMMGGAKFVIAKKREGSKVCEWTHRDGKCGTEKVYEWKGRPLDAPLCKRCCEEAEALRQEYLRQWPEMAPYWNWVQSRVSSTGELEQFVSKRIRGGLSGPQGANTLFQGLAADGAKRAVVAMTKEMYLDRASPLYGSRLVLFAHDETLIEIPEERAHEAAMRQAELMVEKMREVVPDVKVKAEPALMRRWYKGAEATFDSSGRLVPWEPERKAQ